jgi:hypothetical protein
MPLEMPYLSGRSWQRLYPLSKETPKSLEEVAAIRSAIGTVSNGNRHGIVFAFQSEGLRRDIVLTAYGSSSPHPSWV